MSGKRLVKARNTWCLDLGEDGWYIRVRIFRNQKAMQKAYTQYKGTRDELGPLVRAAVLEGPFLFRPTGHLRRREMKRELAHVLMHRKDLTVFLVGHELQHVLLFWKRKMKWRFRRPSPGAGSLEERFCDIMGRLTRDFWKRMWRYKLVSYEERKKR